MSGELFAALCLTVFKQSEKMVDVLYRAGKHYDRLRLMELDMRALINSQSLPPYIRKTADKAFSCCCRKPKSSFVKMNTATCFVISERNFSERSSFSAIIRMGDLRIK